MLRFLHVKGYVKMKWSLPSKAWMRILLTFVISDASSSRSFHDWAFFHFWKCDRHSGQMCVSFFAPSFKQIVIYTLLHLLSGPDWVGVLLVTSMHDKDDGLILWVTLSRLWRTHSYVFVKWLELIQCSSMLMSYTFDFDTWGGIYSFMFSLSVIVIIGLHG
jgi:hypothetical protein